MATLPASLGWCGRSVATVNSFLNGRHIGVDHHLNEFFKRGAGHPTKFLLGQSGVADEQIHFSGTEELGIGANTHHAVLVGGDGVDVFSRPR